MHATLGSDLVLDPERPEYHRATLEWCPRAAPAGLDGLLAGARLDGGDDDDDDADAAAKALPVAQSTGRQIGSRLTSMRAARRCFWNCLADRGGFDEARRSRRSS